MSTTSSNHRSSPSVTRPPSTGRTLAPRAPASSRAASADSCAAPTPGSTSCAPGDDRPRPRPGDDPPSHAAEELRRLSTYILWRYHIQLRSARAIARELGFSHVAVWRLIQRHAADQGSIPGEPNEDGR
jgi:hypothetical protein